MTIRSQSNQWSKKAGQYVQEAKSLGVFVKSPSIQASEIGFTISGNSIYFGLNGIKGIGVNACRAIIKARKAGKFKDIWDFMSRIDTRVVNAKIIEALTHAGAFDSLGYKREDILENLEAIVRHLPALAEYYEHERNMIARNEENARIDLLREDLESKIKLAKQIAKDCKKAQTAIPPKIERYLNFKETLEILADRYAAGEVLDPDDSNLLDTYGNLRKLPALKPKTLPEAPVLNQYRDVPVSIEQLINQADYIGCYLETHPARLIFPNTTPLFDLDDTVGNVAGAVSLMKIVTTKRKQEMAFMEINDGTDSAEIVIMPDVFAELKSIKSIPAEGDIIRVIGEVETIDPGIKIKAGKIKLYRRINEHM